MGLAGVHVRLYDGAGLRRRAGHLSAWHSIVRLVESCSGTITLRFVSSSQPRLTSPTARGGPSLAGAAAAARPAAARAAIWLISRPPGYLPSGPAALAPAGGNGR